MSNIKNHKFIHLPYTDDARNSSNISIEDILWYLTGDISQSEMIEMDKIMSDGNEDFYTGIIESVIEILEANNYNVSTTLNQIREASNCIQQGIVIPHFPTLQSNDKEVDFEDSFKKRGIKSLEDDVQPCYVRMNF
jgi:hypothetical protein